MTSRGGRVPNAGARRRRAITRFLGVALCALMVAGACSESETAAPAPPAPTARAAEGLSWERGADLPTPRTEVAVAALDGRVYVAGGFTGDGRSSDVVEAYDPASDSWQTSTRLPTPLHHTALAAAAGRLFVVGGYRADGTSSNRVWSWAPGERSWRNEPPIREPRGALAVAVLDDTIYAVGGATGFGGGAQLSGTFERQDEAAPRWQLLPGLPFPRDHLAAAVSRGNVYAIGGRELSLAANKAIVDVYDAGSHDWFPGGDLPTARGGLAAATLGDRIFVFGGEEPTGTIGAAEVFQPGTGWTVGPSMPTPRHGLGAAAVGDRIYVIGGGPEPGLTVSGANEILVVS